MAFDPTREPTPASRLRPGVRIGAVVSRYHAELTGSMLRGALAVLREAGLEDDASEVVWVPGAFELPLVARRLAEREDIDAVLALGVILKGETSHDEYIAHAVVQGITQAQLETDTPVLFGVLTCNTLEQARARALGEDERLDKGHELGRATVEVLDALERTQGQELDAIQRAAASSTENHPS